MKPDLTPTLLQLKSKPWRVIIQLTILIIMNADITLTESQDSMQELSPDENSACSGDSQQCEAGGSTG